MSLRFRGFPPFLPSLAVLLCCLAETPGPVHAQCTWTVDGDKWCGPTDIAFYWGTGLNGPCGPLTECLEWKFAIRAAAQDFNLIAILDLATPLSFVESGAVGDNDPLPPGSISFEVFNTGTVPCGVSADGNIASAANFHGQPTGGAMLPITNAVISFNGEAPWDGSGYDRETVVLHEIMHALGVGHGVGTCLMCPIGCGEQIRADGCAISALQCIYGDPFGSGCGTNMGLLLESVVPATGQVDLFVGECDCSGGGCAKKRAEPAELTYEFAINESGGPYTVFATVPASSLTNRRFSHQFTQSYQSALIRLRALDGGSQVNEAYLTFPITIELASTATPPAVVPNQALAVSTAPNPFLGQTVVSFNLPRPANVEVVVYDAAGRRVTTLRDGELDGGEHQITWDGRAADGRRAASGIYHCVVHAGLQRGSATLAILR